MSLKYWEKEGDLFVQKAEKNWARIWDESILYIVEEKGRYNIIFESGEQGKYPQKKEVVATEPSLEQATQTAKKYMKKYGDKVLVNNNDRDKFIIQQLHRLYAEDLNSRKINSVVSNHLDRNYNVLVEYEDNKTGKLDQVNGSIKTSLHNERILLVTPKGREPLRSISLTRYDVGVENILHRLISEKGLYSDKSYIELSKEYVYGNGDVPDIRDELLQRVGEKGAEMIKKKWNSYSIHITQ